MAKEINNTSQENQTDDNWNPFDGLGPYRGEDDNSEPDRVDTNSPAPQEGRQAKQPEPQQRATQQTEEKKGGGLLEPFFEDDNSYFDDAKEEGEQEEGENAQQDAPQRGHKALTAEDREAQEINALFDVFVEDYGWKDIPQESRPRTAKEFSEFVSAVIAENSKPSYAHPKLQALDQYVRSGGDLDNYFKSVAEMNYDTMSVDNEYDQKRAVAESLRLQGYNADQIKNRVENYVKGGILQDEAQYALAQLRQYFRSGQTADYTTAVSGFPTGAAVSTAVRERETQSLKQMDDVMGAKLTNKERRELFEYMFRQNKDGYSQFMIDYSNNPVNYITAAYICKYGDEAFRRMDSASQKRAIDRFKETIVQQNTKSRGQQRTAQSKNRAPRFTDLAKI